MIILNSAYEWYRIITADAPIPTTIGIVSAVVVVMVIVAWGAMRR